MTMRTTLFALGAVALFVLLALVGGAGSGFDRAVVIWWTVWRAGAPGTTSALVAFTQLGGFTVLLGIVGLATAWLLWRGEQRDALLFAGTVLSGRLTVEGLKLLVARPRPSFDAHPVTVLSNSFPSAHSANSMTTFLALALFVAPVRWRRQAVAGAVALSLMVGSTRPMLGVHWPTDVLAGWLFGLTWVGVAWALSQRGRSAA
jgi:undecaprenyl-diphosphatase